MASKAECGKCGRPLWECADHERLWYPQRQVCYVTMEREAAESAYDALHEDRPYHDGTFRSWVKDRSRSHPHHYRDGVTVYVTPVDHAPWDEFTTRESASPLPPDEPQPSDPGGTG